MRGVGFSPDGRTALTACDDGVRLWDVVTARRLGPVLPHVGPVRCWAFRRDGGSLVTADAGNAVRTWGTVEPAAGTAERLTRWVEVLTRSELESGEAAGGVACCGGGWVAEGVACCDVGVAEGDWIWIIGPIGGGG